MEWTVVRIDSKGKGRTAPFASVGRGQIDFNAAACELLGDYNRYQYAQFLKGKKDGKICIGVRFLTEHIEDSVRITRKQQNGKLVAGMTLHNKGVIQELFGAKGVNDGVERLPVFQDGTDILVITL